MKSAAWAFSVVRNSPTPSASTTDSLLLEFVHQPSGLGAIELTLVRLVERDAVHQAE